MKQHNIMQDGKIIFSYVDMKDVPEEYKEEFSNWMRGQTIPMIPGVDAVYSWDWDRWYEHKTKGTKLIWY